MLGSLPNDTLPEAEKVLLDIYRQMPVERKWELIFDMYRTARELHAAGVRIHNPAATDDDVLTEWFRATLDKPLFHAVQKYRRLLAEGVPLEQLRSINAQGLSYPTWRSAGFSGSMRYSAVPAGSGLRLRCLRLRDLPRTPSMPTITFVNEKKEIQVEPGANLRRAAIDAGVQLYPGIHRLANCRGLAQCGSCRVLITKGMENASPMGLLEKGRLKVSMAYIGNEDSMRLACQTEVHGDMTVQTKPPLNLYGDNFFS